MADAGIKKVVIPNNELPLIRFDDTELFYDLRYRIISEDKNRISHWSKIERIVMPTTTEADLPYTTVPRISIYSVNAESGNKAITAIWTFPQDPSEFNPDPYKAELERRFSQVTSFDIFVRWSENTSGPVWTDWKYETTVSSNSFTILRQTTPFVAKRIEISIQVPSEEKILEPRLELFETVHAV